MPWQRYVADIAYEIDPDTGLLAYREVRLTVPRQQGKSTMLVSMMAHRCVAMGSNQRVGYTAQTGKDARQRWDEEHVPLLEASPLAARMKVRRSIGTEHIKWANGSLWSLLATTETAGHGAQLDLGVIDEAFALHDDRLEQAMKPAMVTRPQPQLWIVSTAGTDSSLYLNEKTDDGRLRAAAGQTSSVAYFEWSAPDDADPADPATWLSCMPAIGHTVTVEAIRSNFESMREPEFRRAFLNQRQNRLASEPWQVIKEDDWDACFDVSSEIAGEPVLALDVTPSRSMASLSAAGLRADGLHHVEIIGNRPGTSWIFDWFQAEDRVARYPRLIIDPVSSAGSLVPELRALGLQIEEVSTRQFVAACGKFYDLTTQHRLRHLGQVPLNAALAGAKRRPLGDAWAWQRRDPSVDVSPLVAATLALDSVVRRESSGDLSLQIF